MKKILLSLMLICAFAIAEAQVICGTGTIKRWDGSGAPGDQGTGQAGNPGNLFIIDGSSVDWIQHITGPYNYAGTPRGGFEPDPHIASVSPANVQLDGLRNASAPNYDRDVPGQDHRDLRYFAFTYDQANVYFYFRRPKNNTAQVSLYYFIDINVDGYMKTGEPVIKVTFNNSGSDIEMGWYEAVNSNALAAGSYDPVKGNTMSATTIRAKNPPSTSEWAIGSADGWNMPGVFHELGNNVNLPGLVMTNGIQEVFDAATLVDTHPDGTEPGYGVEFAVPFSYIGMYTAAGLTSGTSLTYTRVFTWHVSLGSGNSGIAGAEDNAGGCCSGVALSGLPNISATLASFGSNPNSITPFDYRLTIPYKDNAGVNTKVATSRITIRNPKDANGVDLDGADVATWILTGFKDVNCNADATEGSIVLDYEPTLSEPNDADGVGGNKDYVFLVPDPATDGLIIVPANGTACFYVNLNTAPGGFPPLKTANVGFVASTEFDIPSNDCFATQIGGTGTNLDVLPVKFLSFNAVRNGDNVNLAWQTATEENSKGFEIQRMIGAAGGWQTVGYVSTQAVNGTSSSALNYQFADLGNSTKAISQYRLKQVDKDNRGSYSIIRSVRGQGQKGNTIVYPNPSSDGRVSIIFEDVNGTRDVSVTDMSGRVIKQMRGITNNNITIENLTAGMYTVRIVSNETGEQEVQKFVVNKR